VFGVNTSNTMGKQLSVRIDDDLEELIEKEKAKSPYEHHGVVLYSGPTGVGKTTLMNAHNEGMGPHPGACSHSGSHRSA